MTQARKTAGIKAMNLLPLFLVVQLAAGMPEPMQADIAWIAEGEFCEPETVLPLPDDTLL